MLLHRVPGRAELALAAAALDITIYLALSKPSDDEDGQVWYEFNFLKSNEVFILTPRPFDFHCTFRTVAPNDGVFTPYAIDVMGLAVFYQKYDLRRTPVMYIASAALEDSRTCQELFDIGICDVTKFMQQWALEREFQRSMNKQQNTRNKAPAPACLPAPSPEEGQTRVAGTSWRSPFVQRQVRVDGPDFQREATDMNGDCWLQSVGKSLLQHGLIRNVDANSMRFHLAQHVDPSNYDYTIVRAAHCGFDSEAQALSAIPDYEIDFIEYMRIICTPKV